HHLRRHHLRRRHLRRHHLRRHRDQSLHPLRGTMATAADTKAAAAGRAPEIAAMEWGTGVEMAPPTKEAASDHRTRNWRNS
ncbi:MAG: hypothetical protein WBO09_10325, partial [Methylocystis silviterrae]|uniref:hypothetical protein n=1 Tax=Methylocystis silviterrae TaxID=2743612 RepID=UPI003C76C62A